MPIINWPKKIQRIPSLIFMELFTEILILVQCVLVINLDFWQDKVFKNILQFWRKNSNIFKSKVLLELKIELDF